MQNGPGTNDFHEALVRNRNIQYTVKKDNKARRKEKDHREKGQCLTGILLLDKQHPKRENVPGQNMIETKIVNVVGRSLGNGVKGHR